VWVVSRGILLLLTCDNTVGKTVGMNNHTITPERIKALRGRLRMTQDEFARKLGLATRGAVSRLEGGSRTPTGPLLHLLLVIEADPSSVRLL
jgi:DNA-binding transcriptional regulator YiaG